MVMEKLPFRNHYKNVLGVENKDIKLEIVPREGMNCAEIEFDQLIQLIGNIVWKVGVVFSVRKKAMSSMNAENSNLKEGLEEIEEVLAAA